MTEKTTILGIRLNTEDKRELSKYINRESLEHILGQIKRGEITITPKGVVIERVNKISETVNTLDCDNCPYATDLNLAGFEEVCECKGIDRQRALDKCVQMLWR